MPEYTDAQLLRALRRVKGEDWNPRNPETALAPFRRALERDPEASSKVAGVRLYLGVPVTDEERERLKEVKRDAFARYNQEEARQEAINEGLRLAEGDSDREFVERVALEQHPDHAEALLDAYENPDEHERAEPVDSAAAVDREVRAVLAEIAGRPGEEEAGSEAVGEAAPLGWADVDRLRELADGLEEDEGAGPELRELADRIASTLPPRD